MRLSRLSSLSLIGLMVIGLGFASRSHAATTKITITPTPVTVASGHIHTFTVMAVDSNGTSKDVTADSALSTNDPKGKVVGAVYTGGEVGTWAVQASYQSFVVSTGVTVTSGDLAEIVVNPNSEPEVVLTGTTTKFTAAGFDAQRNTISGLTFTWSTTGAVGTMNSAGVFTPKQVGTGKVQAQSGTVIGQVAIEVRQAPVTNTNTATPINANTNRSTNQNTNAVANANQNTNTTNVNTATNTNTAAVPASSTCTSLKPWVWRLILIIFLILVAVLFGLVPVTKIWPVVIALIGAGILAYIQRKYDCNLQSWWAWVITLGTVALTALAIRSNPMTGGQKPS